MHIAYTTTFSATDVHNWSGTPYYMSRTLQRHAATVDYLGNLRRQLPPFFKCKQFFSQFLSGQRESPRFNLHVAQQYSAQIAKQLINHPAQIVLSPQINPIAYLDCKQPIVLWTDALYGALVGFYEAFSTHSAATIRQGNLITAAALARCQLAIFSSDWAANSAIELYGTSRDKVKVVPFGANIEEHPSWEEIQVIVKNRAQDKIKLLFLAKSWERKGGDIVLKVARALHTAGIPVELTIVGYEPRELKSAPDYVRSLGFISKQIPENREKLRRILAESHFLFVPSRAEAYGIVFCEANAYGVPCLTTGVGGIGTVVKDHINGMKFGLDAPISHYCDYITQFLHDRAAYETLAFSAYNEYVTRLNWNSAVGAVKKLLGS